VNYQQIGDSESVNKAIKIELEATNTHLYEAWHSKANYYRKAKYPGWKRLGFFPNGFGLGRFILYGGMGRARLDCCERSFCCLC